MARQVETLQEHIYMQKKSSLAQNKRQTLWIVVEDEAFVDNRLEQQLRASKLPFLYIAHGPTRKYGKAQWKIGLHAVQILRDHFFGDGPVPNLDDDARISPVLLQKIWKVGTIALRKHPEDSSLRLSIWVTGRSRYRMASWQLPLSTSAHMVGRPDLQGWTAHGLDERKLSRSSFSYRSQWICYQLLAHWARKAYPAA